MKYTYIFSVLLISSLFLTSCGEKDTTTAVKTPNTTVESTPEVALDSDNDLEENTTNNENDLVNETTFEMISEKVGNEDILETPTVENTAIELSEEEEIGLVRMREEEKLAHDVYLTLYNTWKEKIFLNISKSEQSHTNAIKTLLDAYGIEDSVKDNAVGVFAISEMQELYNELVAKGNVSIEEALTVGAIIEDLDIKDLQVLSENLTHSDILAVYANLERGSRNHMRAFTKNLDARDIGYTPFYISEEYYQEIISGEQEKGGHK